MFNVLISILIIVHSVKCQFGISYREPKLECSSDGIRLKVEPLGLFTGHVYVKGFFQSKACHVDYSQERIASSFFMDIAYRGDCNVRRHHSTHPTTVSYETTVIIQHHPLFITAGDRAYRLNCIYRQLDSTVTQHLNINELQEEKVENSTKPSCSYDVMTLDGSRIRYANVGEEIIHKWQCDSNNHGFLVHSCTVRNDVGEEYQMIDERGCSTDRGLVPELLYSADLNSVTTNMRAFRFADQMSVHFSCRLTLCSKEEQGCEGIAPPTCQPIPFGEIKTTYKTMKSIELQSSTEVPATSVTTASTASTTSTAATSTTSSNVFENKNQGSQALSESIARFNEPATKLKIETENEEEISDWEKMFAATSSLPFTVSDVTFDTHKAYKGSSKWLDQTEYENVPNTEYGLEIVDVGSESSNNASRASKTWLEKDSSADISGYRTRSLSSAVEVPAASQEVEEGDIFGDVNEAEIYYGNRKPRSHKTLDKAALDSLKNVITMDVEAGEIIILASDNGPLSDVHLNHERMNGKITRRHHNEVIELIGLCSAIALQITLICIIFIQRFYYTRRLNSIKNIAT